MAPNGILKRKKRTSKIQRGHRENPLISRSTIDMKSARTATEERLCGKVLSKAQPNQKNSGHWIERSCHKPRLSFRGKDSTQKLPLYQYLDKTKNEKDHKKSIKEHKGPVTGIWALRLPKESRRALRNAPKRRVQVMNLFEEGRAAPPKRRRLEGDKGLWRGHFLRLEKKGDSPRRPESTQKINENKEGANSIPGVTGATRRSLKRADNLGKKISSANLIEQNY